MEEFPEQDPLDFLAPEDNRLANYDDAYQPQWDRGLRMLALVFLIVAGIYTFTLLAPILVILALSLMFAFVLSKPVSILFRYTFFSWAGSTAMVYLAVIILILNLLMTLVPRIGGEVSNLITNLEDSYSVLQETALEYTPDQGIVVIFGTGVDMNFILEPVMDLISGQQVEDENQFEPVVIAGETIDLQSILNSTLSVVGSVTGWVTALVGSFAGFISSFLLSVFVSFLIIIDLPNTRQILERYIPKPYHREYGLLFQRMERVWNGFLRGQATIGLVITILTWGQLSLMGIPGATVLALIVGLLSLIPTVGGIIAIIPLFIVPVLTGSNTMTDISNVGVAFLVVLINLLITQLIWNVVAPKILGDALELPLPVIILGVFVGAAVAGILGAFLVAPVVSSIRVITAYLVAKIRMSDPYPHDPPDVPLFHSDV